MDMDKLKKELPKNEREWAVYTNAFVHLVTERGCNSHEAREWAEDIVIIFREAHPELKDGPPGMDCPHGLIDSSRCTACFDAWAHPVKVDERQDIVVLIEGLASNNDEKAFARVLIEKIKDR